MGTYVKKFKEYEKTYRTEIKAQHERLEELCYLNRDKVTLINSWGRRVYWWHRDQIDYAVYEAKGHVEWQIFRAALKGLTTQEKLFCLDDYLDNHREVSGYYKIDDAIRVHNYIGALVRGGQLSTQEQGFKILK